MPHSITCPNCGSEEVSKPKFSKRAFVIAYVLYWWPLLFLSKECHCFDCGADFKYRKTES